MRSFFVVEDTHGVIAVVGHDCVHTACQGLDRTVDGASAIIVDALALDAIFLVRDAHGGFYSSQQGAEWGSVWDLAALFVTEGDVTDSKGLGATALNSVMGVFSNPKQVVEGNVDEISNSLLLGIAVVLCVVAVVLENGFCDGYRDCKLGAGLWVLSFVAVNHALDWAPVLPICVGLVDGRKHS